MAEFNYRVIALDPGGTTGWGTYSAVRSKTDKGWAYADETWACGSLGPEDHHAELYHLLELQRVREYTVVCESFEFRQFDGHRMGIELISKEYIGTAKTYCALEGVRHVAQTAAQAKTFVPDKGPMANKKLRAMGLWHPGRDNRHAMDAYRHLVHYLVAKERRYDLVESWKNL